MQEAFDFENYWDKWEQTEDDEIDHELLRENARAWCRDLELDAGTLSPSQMRFPKKHDFGSRTTKRQRERRHKGLLKRNAERNYMGYYPRTKEREWADTTDGEEVAYIERRWRGRRSKYIKKLCSRLFRRSSKYRMLATRCKGIVHRATEFWWEYD